MDDQIDLRYIRSADMSLYTDPARTLKHLWSHHKYLIFFFLLLCQVGFRMLKKLRIYSDINPGMNGKIKREKNLDTFIQCRK